MALHRRELLAMSGAGILGSIAGCLPGAATGTGELTIGTSHPDPQTIEIEIAPDTDAARVFTETVTVSPDSAPIEREEVVTGRNGDHFYVVVRQQTQDATFETDWELDCTDADRPDRLDVLIAEWGEIQFTQNRCASGMENSPTDPSTA